MPSVRDAMMASLALSLAKRDIIGEANDVKTTFSSWDHCMAKTYCKWPVIAAIIIASLILLSVISCLVRCLCCGVSCCCSCFSCLKCCGSNCCGCCDNPRDKKHKHLDEEYTKFHPGGPASVGYQAPSPMMAGGAGQPKFATFEVGPNGHAIAPKVVAVNDDALPPMPSWDTASKRRIPTTEEEKEGVELGELDPSTGQKVPLMSGAVPMSRAASPGMMSPAPSPYSEVPVQGHDYMSAGTMAAGGAMGGAAMMGGGRGTPNDPYAQRPRDPYSRGPGPNGYRGPGSAAPSPYSQPASPVPQNRGPGQNQYDQFFDQGDQNQNMGQAAYGAAGYGGGRPGMQDRQYTGGSNRGGMAAAGGRQFQQPGMQRQYSQDAPPYRTNSPANNGTGRSPYGGYAQPVPRGIGSGLVEMPSPIDHRTTSPAQQNNTGFDFGDVSGGGGYVSNAGNTNTNRAADLGHQRQQSRPYEMDSSHTGYSGNNQYNAGSNNQNPPAQSHQPDYHQQGQNHNGYQAYDGSPAQGQQQRW